MPLVYRFRTWDITTDCYQQSHRWATLERINKLGGEIDGPGIEVDAELIGKTTAGDEVEGMMARSTGPHSRSPHGMT